MSVLPVLRPRGRFRLPLALAMAGLLAGPLLAQAGPDAVPAEPDTVQVTLTAFTLHPERDAAGAPVLDDNGQPVILRVPLQDSALTPGEAVLYVIEVANPTEATAAALTLRAEVAAEVLLDPHSLVGPEGLVTDWSDAEAPDTFRPLFAVIDGERVLQADLDALRALRLTLPDLPPDGRAQVEYTVTLR